MPPAKKYQRREANLGGLIEKLELMQEELGGNGKLLEFQKFSEPNLSFIFIVIFVAFVDILFSEQKKKRKRRKKLMSLPV
jgi:hypothetical protein